MQKIYVNFFAYKSCSKEIIKENCGFKCRPTSSLSLSPIKTKFYVCPLAFDTTHLSQLSPIS